MKVFIHNDGKEKYQSFEARLYPAELQYGYGENKEEAIKNLKQNVKEYINVLQNINYDETIEVAWDNTPIKEYKIIGNHLQLGQGFPCK